MSKRCRNSQTTRGGRNADSTQSLFVDTETIRKRRLERDSYARRFGLADTTLHHATAVALTTVQESTVSPSEEREKVKPPESTSMYTATGRKSTAKEPVMIMLQNHQVFYPELCRYFLFVNAYPSVQELLACEHLKNAWESTLKVCQTNSHPWNENTVHSVSPFIFSIGRLIYETDC